MFDGGELQAMSDEGLIDALRRAHGAAAFAQAAEVLAVRELYRRRRAAEEREGTGGERAGEFAVTEAAAAVPTSEAVAAALVEVGLGLETLPRTAAAFGSGRIDLARAQIIVDNVRDLPDELRAEVEQTLVEAAVRSNPPRLRQTARRWITKVDPDGEQSRRELRESRRDVRITAMQDGVATFDGLLPAVGAQTVAMRLREMSEQVCEADPRTMPQRRADALVALADGSGRLRCECGHGECCPARHPQPGSARRPLIQIGVPAGTLLGTGDDPALLAGYGPIDAELARRIAGHAHFEVIPERTGDPTTSEESARPEPPEWLDREIRALDGMCRFPGCTVPAVGAPVDHSEPFDTAHTGRGGATVMANLAVLCTRHNRLKSLADNGLQHWDIRRLGADELQWVSPAGDSHVGVREGGRYLFPHTDTEAPAARTDPPTVISESRMDTVDLTYPIEHHALDTLFTPEDELPTTESRSH